MPNIIGTRGTSSFGASGTGERMYDVSSHVFLLDPGNNALLTMLTNIGKVSDGVTWKGSPLKKKAVIDPVFKEFEDSFGASKTQLDGAISATSTTSIKVDDASIFTPNDIAIAVHSTGAEEQMLVTAVNTSTQTLTVTRGFGTSALSSIADNSYIYIIGNASEEGASTPTSNATAKTTQTNYTQIFRTSYALTNTEISTQMYTGDESKYQNTKQGIEHALDIERAFWFGNQNSATGSGGQLIRTTGGIVERINELGSSYIQDESSSSLTEAEFIAFLKKGFQHGSTNKYLFCSGTVLQAINGFASGSLQITPKDKTYGVQISTYLSSWGAVNLVYNPLFVDDYDGMAVLLDFDTLEYNYLSANGKNRDTKLYTNRQAPGVDGEINEYITECGLARHNFQKNALLKGVTG